MLETLEIVDLLRIFGEDLLKAMVDVEIDEVDVGSLGRTMTLVLILPGVLVTPVIPNEDGDGRVVDAVSVDMGKIVTFVTGEDVLVGFMIILVVFDVTNSFTESPLK